MNKEIIDSVFALPPVIETPRLLLRAVEIKDAEDMFEYSSDPDVTEYLTWEPHESLEFTKHYIGSIERAYKHGNFHDWAVVLKAKNKMIGTCGFTSFNFKNNTCEIGYVLNPRYRGYSLMPEAANCVISFAFERLGADKVEGRFMEENIASRRVMEKCGMIYKGRDEKTVKKNGALVPVGICEIKSDRAG